MTILALTREGDEKTHGKRERERWVEGGKGREGEGRERKGKEKGREEKGRKGKKRKGKEKKGKERKGKGRGGFLFDGMDGWVRLFLLHGDTTVNGD